MARIRSTFYDLARTCGRLSKHMRLSHNLLYQEGVFADTEGYLKGPGMFPADGQGSKSYFRPGNGVRTWAEL